MTKDVNKIISNSFDTIKGDGVLAMLLLKTYSKLYRDGQQVRTCERSMLKYYQEILKDGKMKAELKKQIEERVCVPNFKGTREVYTRSGIVLVKAEYLTDEAALNFIEKKILSKSDFETQPTVKKKVAEKKAETK